jgi:hypothetical protein
VNINLLKKIKMKYQKIYHLLLSAIFLFYGCSNSNGTYTKTETNKINETLKSITTQENVDFYKKDFNAWSNHFDHSNALSWVCVEDDVTLRATGWDDLNRFVGSWMKINPKPESDTDLKLDSIIDFKSELSKNLAYVTFKKQHHMPDGKTRMLLENRVFKLIGADWKIISLTSVPAYNTPKSTNNIFLHNDSN